MNKLVSLAGTLAVLAPWSVRAEPLSLGEAIHRALQKSSAALSARGDLAVAEAALRTARAVPNPSLSLSLEKIPIDGTPAGTTLGNGLLERGYDSIAALSELVEAGGKRHDRRLAATAGIEAARSRVRDAERLLVAEVTRSYTAALLASANAASARVAADSLETTASLAREREGAGEISRVDREQVELLAGRFRADAAGAEAAERASLLALQTLLGEAVSGNGPDLTDGLESLARASLGLEASEETADDVVERRPDIVAARASLAKAEADVALQKALRVPDPTLSFQYERQPPDQRNTVGVAVSLSLPLLDRNAGGIGAAQAARDAAARDLATLRLRAVAELARTRASYAAAAERVRRYSEELLPRSESVRETVGFAYREGSASLLELLEAERAASDVRLALAAARADLITTAAEARAARALLPEVTR